MNTKINDNVKNVLFNTISPVIFTVLGFLVAFIFNVLMTEVKEHRIQISINTAKIAVIDTRLDAFEDNQRKILTKLDSLNEKMERHLGQSDKN